MSKLEEFNKLKWIIDKQLDNGTISNSEWLAINEAGLENYSVVLKTEKACQLEWLSDYGRVKAWVPKSCL